MSSTPTPVFMQKPTDATGGLHGWVAAPLRRRTLAWIVDVTILGLTAILLTVPIAAVLVDGGPFTDAEGVLADITADSSTTAQVVNLAFLAIAVALTALYNGVLTARQGDRSGQTLGKQWLKIRVVAADGAPLTPARAWRRAQLVTLLLFVLDLVGALLDLALGTTPWIANGTDVFTTSLLALVIITAFRSPIRQTLYDRPAGTAVVMAVDAQTVWDPAVGAWVPKPQPDPVSGTIRPRVRDEGTWVLVVFAALALLANLATSLWPGLLD